MPREPLARLLGLGRHLPDPVSNDELARELGTTAAELASSTGIARRHHAPDGEGPSDLAVRAAGDALAAAKTDVGGLGRSVCATSTPDVAVRGSACFLQ